MRSWFSALVVCKGEGDRQGRGEERQPSQSGGERLLSRRSARGARCQGSSWVANVGFTEGKMHTLAK